MTAFPVPAPTSFGERYVVQRELGRGGMATVYLAEDRKHERHVAIKVLKPELAASVGVDRFLREIGITARLSHPHIVPLIDSGQADGLLFYVSAFVSGGSLRDRLRIERQIPVKDAIRIVEEVGAGLDYAHRSGLVHRDVKPENILFADGLAVLTDFGIARVASGATANDVITEVGLAVGTPEYMSPEQASGEHELDAASDVYSLACVMYEMLAGTPPFRGENARATMARQLTEHARPVRTLRPEAPVAVEHALARALAKTPAERFASITEFLAALRRTDASGADPYTTAGRSIAVLPFVNASPDPENEYLSDGITDELIFALAGVPGLRVASRTSVFALKGTARDVRAIGALLGASVILEGTVRKAGERLRVTAQLTSAEDGRLLWSHRYDRTLRDVFEIQDELARTIVDTLRVTSFADLAPSKRKRYTENVEAYGLYLKGRYAWNKRSQEGVNEGIRWFEQAIEADPKYALAYTGLADCYALQIDYRSIHVVKGFERARTYARKALELDDSLAEAHASLAWTLFIYDWDWGGAAREFKRAVQLDGNYATARQWHGAFLASQGKIDAALVEGHTAQELDSASVSVRRTLGVLYVYARNYDQARYHLERASAMNRGSAETHRVLGVALSLAGDHDRAERAVREALAMPEAGSYSLATLGYVLGRAGRSAEAEEILARLRADRESGYVSPVGLAMVHLGLGDIDAALEATTLAYHDRRGWVAYLRVHPVMDPMRGHPRFDALARRLGL